jgi:hypothetical protein
VVVVGHRMWWPANQHEAKNKGIWKCRAITLESARGLATVSFKSKSAQEKPCINFSPRRISPKGKKRLQVLVLALILGSQQDIESMEEEDDEV